MNKKNITIDDLAIMINNGFEKTATKEQVEGLELRMDKIEGKMTNVEIRLDNIEDEVSEIRKHQIAHTIYRDEFEKLESKVRVLEKLLLKIQKS